jgi:hypothetical protein
MVTLGDAQQRKDPNPSQDLNRGEEKFFTIDTPPFEVATLSKVLMRQER